MPPRVRLREPSEADRSSAGGATGPLELDEREGGTGAQA